MIHGSVVLNTLLTRSTSMFAARLDLYLLSVKPAGHWSTRTVLRDSFRFLCAIERYEIEYIVLHMFIGRESGRHVGFPS